MYTKLFFSLLLANTNESTFFDLYWIMIRFTLFLYVNNPSVIMSHILLNRLSLCSILEAIRHWFKFVCKSPTKIQLWILNSFCIYWLSNSEAVSMDLNQLNKLSGLSFIEENIVVHDSGVTKSHMVKMHYFFSHLFSLFPNKDHTT